jgi:hypothetical protein
MNLTTQTVILAGTWTDAQMIADKLGLFADEWSMPTAIGHIRGRAEAPVFFDFATFERNPAREQLREWFAWRLTPPSRRPPQLPGKLNAPKEDRMATQKTEQPTPRPAWDKGLARGVGLDYLNQTTGNVVAVDKDGDPWKPDPTTGVWVSPELDDQIAPEFGPFDLYAA